MKIRGRIISKGIAEGEALVTKEAITFLGGVDPKSGVVVEKGHELEGKKITDKILIFPNGKGSTVGSYTIYQLKKNKVAPKGIINVKAEQMVATGAIIGGIPMIDSLKKDPLKIFKNGEKILLNADKGFVEAK